MGGLLLIGPSDWRFIGADQDKQNEGNFEIGFETNQEEEGKLTNDFDGAG